MYHFSMFCLRPARDRRSGHGGGNIRTLNEQGEDYLPREEGISQSREPSLDGTGASDFAGYLHIRSLFVLSCRDF